MAALYTSSFLYRQYNLSEANFMGTTPAPRRDLALFLGGPGLFTLASVWLYQVHPWPAPIPAQGAVMQWAIAAPFLLAGALGVWLAPRIGCPSAPALNNGRAWGVLLGLSIGLGFLLGAEGLFLAEWPPSAHQYDLIARQSGIGAITTWVNVGLPWSIPHYFAAGVLLECLYRLAPIPVLVWLVSSVCFRGRWQGRTYWTVATLAAAQEPLLWLAGIVHGPLPLATSLFVAFNQLQSFAINLLEAAGLRRFGWPATIAFRIAYYAAARVFLPYLLSPHAVSYPGPH
jgi:hypothetical protein